jgi:hypothetical protein
MRKRSDHRGAEGAEAHREEEQEKGPPDRRLAES